MRRVLKFLITGDWHLHQWQDVGPMINTYRSEERSEIENQVPLKCHQPMQCKICGKRKSFTL